MSSQKPKVPSFVVIQAEDETGILLTADGQRCLDGLIHVIHAETLEDARKIARGIVAEHPHIECHIRDEQGLHIESIRHRLHSQLDQVEEHFSRKRKGL